MSFTLGRTLLAILTVITFTSAAGCDRASPPATTFDVGPAGKTVSAAGLTLVVPPGAVEKQVQLKIEHPAAAKLDSTTPLAHATASSIRFGISLSGGLQPVKPIDIAVNLEPGLVPKDATLSQAALYSDGRKGRRFELLPTTFDGSVVRFQLVHLSSKWIVFPDWTKLLWGAWDTLMPSGVGRERPTDCQSELKIGGGETIRLGAGANWSADRTSSVHPCLEQIDGRLRLRLLNNSYLNWPVAAAPKEVVVHSTVDDIDMETVKLVTDRFVKFVATKGYLARGSYVNIDIPATTLPATIEVKADPGIFLSEALAISLTFAVGFFTGEGPAGTLATIKVLLDLPSFVSCLQAAMPKPAARPLADYVADFLTILTSACGDSLLQGLEPYANNPDIWSKFWSRVLAIGGAINSALRFVPAGLEGIVRTVAGTTRITVVSPSACPTPDEFASIATGLDKADFPDTALIRYATVANVVCEGQWAAARVRAYYTGPPQPYNVELATALRYTDGTWQRPSHERAYLCANAPRSITAVLKASCG